LAKRGGHGGRMIRNPEGAEFKKFWPLTVKKEGLTFTRRTKDGKEKQLHEQTPGGGKKGAEVK